jgi:NAD(P)H-hydrate repair Nnr-like enzyme with NAD(P)H-hydrate epimerase domain
MSLPIYAADKIKKWDQFTIENEPISSVDLMERAANTCTKQIVARNIFNSAVIFAALEIMEVMAWSLPACCTKELLK